MLPRPPWTLPFVKFLLAFPKRAGDACLGVVLDMVLGPEEDFEYVSRTTPTDTPPTIS
jgi:hypothetical protein